MTHTVLIVSSDQADAELLQKTLASARDGPFDTEWLQSLQEALARLGQGGIDVILVDLFLSDSKGMATFDTLFALVPPIPIMVISQEDEDLSIEAVKSGAQGYLSKGHLRHSLIPQALKTMIQRKQIEQALYIEHERAQVTLESIGDGVLSTDAEMNITYLNPEAERMTGWSRVEAMGKPIEEVFQLIDIQTGQRTLNPVELSIAQGKRMGLPLNSVLLRRDGIKMAVEDSVAPIFDSNKSPTGAVIIFRDVTESRAMEQKMAHLAQHDYLTGLPNRMLLNDRLNQAIIYANRHNTSLAVLFCDLDNFKHINDSLGHLVGDRLLQSVAQRLVRQVRESDTVCRQGGDEFVILLLEEALGENAVITAEKILLSLSQPYTIGEHELHVTTSIGISLYPGDGRDAESLIRSADTALYHAKGRGRDNYQFFKEEMNARAVERQSLEVDLRRALKQQEFMLYFQPKLNLDSGVITGVEALIRWNHPTRGVMLPGTFIAIAEDCGLIVPLGKWVLEQACQQAKTWLDQGYGPMPIAINISALEFRNAHFVDQVQQALTKSGLEPHYLELELTESVLMKDAETSRSILQSLKEIGVRIAIDDFGTGYSSLNYLNQFPIDVLKIDQSFVRDIAIGEGNGVIVSAVINMGTSLKQKVIAEGIETDEQLAFLNEHACHEGQGYLLCKPLSAAELEKLFFTRETQRAGLAELA
ncbi:MAG TPA: EAL domain-containing protein [Methylophilaceae bacterium]|nr:EAL domain-containing protein [Methylophilaceae bacterium]